MLGVLVFLRNAVVSLCLVRYVAKWPCTRVIAGSVVPWCRVQGGSCLTVLGHGLAFYLAE